MEIPIKGEFELWFWDQQHQISRAIVIRAVGTMINMGQGKEYRWECLWSTMFSRQVNLGVNVNPSLVMYGFLVRDKMITTSSSLSFRSSVFPSFPGITSGDLSRS